MTTFRFGVLVEGNASALQRAAKDGEDALRKLTDRGVVLNRRALDDARRFAKARETLGIRSEHEIRRAIQQTEAAYNRVTRTASMSWTEQRRHASRYREEITRLNNELGRLTTRQKIAFGARGVAAVGAGVGVAAAVMAPKVQAAVGFDTRLAHMANTAFADRDAAGRKAGIAELNAMVLDAVRQGGGTRDSAAGAAELLFGAGIFKPGEVRTILRDAVRGGTANNADSSLFAQMAITGNQTFGIRPDRMAAMFGMGTFAGQQGGFEIKDMARWLPQQMAAAKAVGMTGEAGFAKLAALNQAAVVTAGTRDEAGNNVVNLLAKMGSQDTVKDFKKQGIDLPKHLAEGRMRGLDALDVVGNLLEQQLGKDKNYQAVQRQLARAKDASQRREALESVANIAQGTVIGRVFQDRQALMGLYGYMQGRDRVGKIASGAMANTDAAERNFSVISSMPGYQMEQARQAQENAVHDGMSKLAPVIGSVSGGLAQLMYQYPGYTAAITGATTALVALAGSAATMAVLNGGKLPGLGGLGAAGAALGKGALWAGGVGVAAAGGYGVGTLAYKGLLEGNAGGDLVGRSVARTLSFFGNQNATDALAAEGAGSRTVAQRMGGFSGGGGALSLPLQDFRGEISVRVQPVPGFNVEADTKTNSPRVPFRTDAGTTNRAAGY